MKTRIVWTKMHFDDDWFYELEDWQKYYFMYFFTNEHIGQTGIYELSDRAIKKETGITDEKLEIIKQIFGDKKKVLFYQDWVYVPKSAKYGGYTGPKNEGAYKKELASVPLDAKKYFNDRVWIGYRYSMDTPINNKSEIINNKLEIINDKPEIINNKPQEESDGYKAARETAEKLRRVAGANIKTMRN